jgi:hypothetical protein
VGTAVAPMGDPTQRKRLDDVQPVVTFDSAG